jgi:predicted flap endonuclease-1-like 5' DNA nuclease
MGEAMSDNWPVLVIALVLVLLLEWWLVAASRRTRIERGEARSSDDSPARRNQALIDAQPARDQVDLPPPTPEGLAGMGEAVAAAVEPVHSATSADDLKQIKGIGPKLEKLLNSLGISSYSQIAAWDDDEIDRIDAQLGTFAGRIRRDDWRAQARFLAAGDRTGFERQFGRL